MLGVRQLAAITQLHQALPRWIYLPHIFNTNNLPCSLEFLNLETICRNNLQKWRLILPLVENKCLQIRIIKTFCLLFQVFNHVVSTLKLGPLSTKPCFISKDP